MAALPSANSPELRIRSVFMVVLPCWENLQLFHPRPKPLTAEIAEHAEAFIGIALRAPRTLGGKRLFDAAGREGVPCGCHLVPIFSPI
jgi:hypothetical protein